MIFNHETGELLDEELKEFFQKANAFEEKKEPIKEKINALQEEITSLKNALNSDEIKEEEAILIDEARYLLKISNAKSIPCDFGTIKSVKSQSLVFDGDVEKLPENLLIIKKLPNKAEIKKLVSKGVQIEGAVIEHKENISFSLVK